MKIKLNSANRKTIGDRISEEITLSGIPLKEIAKRIGVTPALISQYKSKKKKPGIENLARLCEVLDISSDYILGLAKL